MQALLPGARLRQTYHRACGLQGIAILVLQLAGVVTRERDDIINQGLKRAPGLQHHLHMIGLLLGKFGAFQKLRHAE